MLSIIVSTSVQLPLIAMSSKIRFVFLLVHFLLLFAYGASAESSSTASERDRRTARIQAAYLTHLVKFTYWQESHLPEAGEAPKIIILGEEGKGFVESLRFLVRQSALKIDDRLVELHHFNNHQGVEAEKMIKGGCQVVYLLKNSTFSVPEIKSLTFQAVVFGEERKFVAESGGDVSFVTARNRVKLVVSAKYFRRTSPKLSSKLANLKSVVEIYPPFGTDS